MGRDHEGRVFSELDVVGHCKQCGKPFTSSMKVVGPTGMFCSDTCRERHEAFMRKVHAMETRERDPWARFRFKIRRFIRRLVWLALLAAILFAVGILFPVPFLSPLVERLRLMAGF